MTRASRINGGSAVVGGLTYPSTPKTRRRAEARGKKRHSYKPLAVQFPKNGFSYGQIMRDGNAAIYEQRWNGCPNPSIAYEVIRIRRREGFHISGRFIEPAEVYPSSQSWGVDGWTVTNKDAAYAKLRKLASGPGIFLNCKLK